MISFCVETLGPKPLCQAFRIPHSQCVDDATAEQIWKHVRQPCHAFRLRWEVNILETEARTRQRAALDFEVRSKLFKDVADDSIVRGRGCGQNGDISGKRSEYPHDSPVVRT